MVATLHNSFALLRRTGSLLLGIGAALIVFAPTASAANFCPPIWNAGTLPLNFNPAFLGIEEFNRPGGGKQEDLIINSFFNVLKDPTGTTVTSFFERDLVSRVRDLDVLDFNTFDPNSDVEELTDLTGPPNVTNWPNEAVRTPDGVVPFEGLILSQGFHPAEPPGRMSIINLDDPTYPEYIVHQSTAQPGGCDLSSTTNNPRFYHQAKFVDMDGDGLKDVVTVRSAFKVAGVGSFCFFVGELVYFKNPGAALDPAVEWEENILVGYPTNLLGPDVAFDIHDFEDDGVPEIVATRFFGPGSGIKIYGAPAGQLWSDVDHIAGPAPREEVIATTAVHGSPFHVEIVDLNFDGVVDVLATNHQGDDCFAVTQSAVPGQVQAFEQPAGGIFTGGSWTTHIIKDNIRPNPSLPEPAAGPGRLAPGLAQAFYPVRGYEGRLKPWILVTGDEASKVWVLVPKRSRDPNNWEYRSSVVFDINDVYGAGTTQTIMGAGDTSPGEVISTIGSGVFRYDAPGPTGRAEIYLPVFEAKEVRVLTMRPGPRSDRVRCTADGALSCPAPAP